MLPVFGFLSFVTTVGTALHLTSAFGQSDTCDTSITEDKPPLGYRDWKLISVAHEAGTLNDLRAILGNDAAINAYRGGRLPFPDGTIIARLAWNFVPSAENDGVFGHPQSLVDGPPMERIQFMIKDSGKYPCGGWGFAEYRDGAPAPETALKGCVNQRGRCSMPDHSGSIGHRLPGSPRHHGLISRLMLPAAIMLMTASTPGVAEDMGANKSQLIRGMLATVVNISTRKDEVSNPSPTSFSASAVSGATPAPDVGQNVRSYSGSGFVIDPSGLIITNYHVVENAFEITVMLPDGSFLPGKMLSASRLSDIAIVKVSPDHPLAAAHWGDSDFLRVGDQVFAAGNAFGLGLSVSAGIVSALNRDIQDSPYDDFIQTDAAINHGNSGGPLFDMRGDVVGVNSTIISPSRGSSGVGFSIPASSAHFIYDQLRNFGWVHPAWIGVKLQEMTPDLAAGLGISHPKGSIVSWVLETGPAEKAGLAIGDVILSYNGNAPTDERALLRDIAHTQAGAVITLTVSRNGSELNVPITTQAWPRDQWDVRDAPTPVSQPRTPILPNLGLTLSALEPEAKKKLNITNYPGGVLVTSVTPYSDAGNRGLARGDVILRVQNDCVTTPGDVLSGIDAARNRKRDLLPVLILPKVRDIPGPKWIALRIETVSE